MFEEHLNVLDYLVGVSTLAVLPTELHLGMQLRFECIEVLGTREVLHDVRAEHDHHGVVVRTTGAATSALHDAGPEALREGRIGIRPLAQEPLLQPDSIRLPTKDDNPTSVTRQVESVITVGQAEHTGWGLGEGLQPLLLQVVPSHDWHAIACQGLGCRLSVGDGLLAQHERLVGEPDNLLGQLSCRTTLDQIREDKQPPTGARRSLGRKWHPDDLPSTESSFQLAAGAESRRQVNALLASSEDVVLIGRRDHRPDLDGTVGQVDTAGRQS